MAKINFTDQDLEKIKNAVKEAESKTAGEIATAFIKESDNYAAYELTAAVLAGLFYFTILTFFTSSIEYALQHMFWDYSIYHLPMFFGVSTFLVIGIVYLLGNIPFIDRLIVPRGVMSEKVNNRAVRHFMESGVYDTRDRTGILIFISNLEQRVELLADKGINEKIPPEKWNDIVRHIIDGIHANQLVKHLCEAIQECGKLLARHYPIQPGDKNELDNEIRILEK
jgi:putative membrane protein